MNDPDIERLRELAAETQSAAARILAERDCYSEALREIATWAEYGYQDLSSPGVLSCVKKRALEALNPEAGKR